MCGLFGFLNYSGKEIKGLMELTDSLAGESAVRGTDATGIAFNGNGGMCILKESKSAYQIKFKHSDNIKALIGHTRHSTQGSEKKNYNNHPFPGKCCGRKFALAHNGVLYNDDELRSSLSLPKSKIETDSYIAVQLLESKRFLDFNSIKFMAEKVRGSFSFSILDEKNNIYLVKGDSPLSILRFPKLKMIVFASTDEILYRAISGSKLIEELKKGNFEEIKISQGDILKICATGRVEKGKFAYNEYIGKSWWEYGTSSRLSSFLIDEDCKYIDDLKAVATCYGYMPEEIDDLLNEGLTPDEIEEFLYCY